MLYISKKKIYFLIATIISFIISPTYLYADEVYPEEILIKISRATENPDYTNIEDLRRSFIKHKGIKDDIITYALTESLIKNKDKIDEKTIELVKSFSFYENKKVSAILNQNYFQRILNSKLFFTKFSIFTLLKYSSLIFIILIFLAFLIKNYYIFLHSHQDLKFASFFYIVFFSLSVLILLTIWTKYIWLILAIATITLITFEKKRTKIVTIIVILCFVMLNSMTYLQKNNENFEIVNIINLPTTKEYLLEKAKETGNDIFKIVAEIKYSENSDKTILFKPTNKLEAGNYAIYLLQRGEIDAFNKLAIQYNLLSDPVIVSNIASFFVKTFQYERYEETIQILYKNYPKYHKLFQEYQLLFKTQVFFPYFTEEKAYFTNISFNIKQILISFFSIIFITLITYFFSNGKIFKCNSCGKVFCIKCDDGYLNENVCERCRIFFNKINKADPGALIKTQLKIEKFQYIKKVKINLLSLVLPGACRISLGQNFLGILLLYGYSILITTFIFGYKPFVMIDNIGFHIVIKQVYVLYIAIFSICYIINIFYKKGS